MKKIDINRIVITTLIMVGFFTGCSKDHLDPSQIGRFRPIPAVNVILDTLGVAEEAASVYEEAEEPRPADVVPYDRNYVLGSGDVIRISIFELLQEGSPYVDNFIVNESGNISIPEIGQIQATGLSETQLEDEIRKSLTPGILKNPSVTVSLVQSESRIFTILGDGVAKPGRYIIPRNDFRLLDAVAVAGSAAQFNVSYIYITKRMTQKDQAGDIPAYVDESQQMGSEMPQDINDSQMLEVIEPSMQFSQLVISPAEMATEDELEKLAAPEEIVNEEKSVEPPTSDVMPQVPQNTGQIEWVFKDGRWVPVGPGGGELQQTMPQDVRQQIPQDTPEQLPPSGKESLPERYALEDMSGVGVQNRVIKIPTDKLFGGDPRYNVIIEPSDTITVRLDVVGEYYVLGNVNNQGIINLTGRPMTLKMAIAAAGGLGQLAWPKKCEVIRRIGEKKEEIVMVDLEKIANGSQPDFFIKPNDVINVGTHGISRYLAVLRNAFRATYGFGFIYDRNFGSRPFGLEHPLSPFTND